MNQPSQIPTAADFFAQAEEDDTDESFDQAYGAAMAKREALHHDVGASLSVGPGMLFQVPPDPMERIADSLGRLADHFDASQTFTGELASTGVSMVPVTAHDALRDEMHERIQGYVEALHDETSKLQTVTEVLAQVEAALGKSTAKPVLAAKAVIEAWKSPQVPETGDEMTPADNGQIAGTEGLDHALETYPPGGLPPVTLHEVEPEELSQEQQEMNGAPVQTVEAPAHDAPVEAWRDYARSKGMAGPQIDKANRSQIRTALGIAHTPAEPGTA